MSSCPTTRYCHSYVICQYNSHCTERFWWSTCSAAPGGLGRTVGVTAVSSCQEVIETRCLCDNFRRIYVRSQSFLRKIETGIARAPRASVRQRLGEKDLRAGVATGVGPVDGTLQDVAERISPEPGAQAGSGSYREADGAVFLR